MSPLDRVLAEAQPDGTFGGSRTPPAPWTPEQQAQHYSDLEAALTGWEWDRPIRRALRNPTRKAA